MLPLTGSVSTIYRTHVDLIMNEGRNDITLTRLIQLIILAACLSPFISHAQEITHVDFTVTGSTVKITYDITTCSGNEDYDVRLMLAHEGDLMEIKRGLSGDIEHVACGSSNIIVWDVLSDREELKGKIFFAVEIVRSHPVITEDPPIAYGPDDDSDAGVVPYGDQGVDPTVANPPRQKTFVAPLGLFQLASWILFEQARTAIINHGRPNVVLQGRSGPAFPSKRRHR